MERGILFTAMIRKATNNNKKAIKINGKGGTSQMSQTKTTTAMQFNIQYAEASGASSDTTLHRRARA